jgi:mycothiol synthase
MQHPHLTPIHHRSFTTADLPALAALLDQIFPDEPISLEQLEHHERTYPAGNPRLRLAAETEDGQVVGYGECERPYRTARPDFFGVFVAVDEAWQHRGIGQALLAAVMPFAEEHGFRKLHCGCRENSADSVHFLEQAGFRQIGIRFESALDLRSFDETPFLAKVERVKAAGYEVITLAEARQQDSEADLRLYDVFAATVVDVPFPGGVRAEPNYATFRAGTLDAPNTPAEGIFIAQHEGRMVALTTLELLPNGLGITGTTGVLAAHRDRGVATLVKLASLRYLQAHGYTEARTHNDTANPSILALNEKLGYRRLPGWLAWEKTL